MPRPSTADLLRKLRIQSRDWLPTTPETVINPLNEPSSTLPMLDADFVHSAISSAEKGDTRNYFALARDAVTADTDLAGLISTRLLAVLGDEPAILPADPKKPEDKLAADVIRDAIGRLDNFKMSVCLPLLRGHIWPIGIIERTYKPAAVPGLTFDWGVIRHVPVELARWTNGYLELERVDPVTRLPTGEWFRPGAAYIAHTGNLLPTPPTWGGPIRGLIWWFFLKTMTRDWWVRFLERFGTPFPVGKFPKDDTRSQAVLERAFKLATRIGGMAVSTNTQIELVQAQTGSADAHQKFYELCTAQMSRAILGQELSSTAKSTGLGSGLSDLQGQVRSDIRQFDAAMLAETLRTHLFRPFLRLNGIPGEAPKIAFGQESEEVSDTADVLAKLKQAGISLAPSALTTLSERVGMQLQLDPAPAQPGRMLSLSAADQTIEGIVLGASSPDDALTRLTRAFPHLAPETALSVVEAATIGGAWGGL